jgi:DNA polymerase-3 subunit alpha
MDLANFTEEEADELRKVIGKKLIEKAGGKEKLKRIGNNFIKRCDENGISKNIAEVIWGQINKFAGYAFNKAHATSYALLTYYTAYLKAHYPIQYMTALLNSAIGKPDKMKNYLTECKRLGIEIVPPRHNHAEKFTCSENTILFGLGAIKGIGSSAWKKIKGRKFEHFLDFVLRVKPERDTLVALIEAGALDGLGYSRRAMLSVAEDVLTEVRSYSRKKNPNQRSLFKTKFEFEIPKLTEFSDRELSAMELDKLGAYIDFNPFDEYKDFVSQHTHTPDATNIPYNQSVRVVCIPIRIKTFLTKASQKEMCICNSETSGDPIELILFPKAYATFKDKIKMGTPILVSGKVVMGEKFSLAADNIDLI